MTAADRLENAVTPENRRKLLAKLLREKARQSQSACPVSAAQRGIWFMQQLDPEAQAYHLPFCVRVLSKIDPHSAKAALQNLIDRHSILRASFRGEGHQVEMLISGAGDADFAQFDVAGSTDVELQERVEQDFREPFDLQKGPLVRLRLFSRDETDHVLLLKLHHLICDGWSLGILLDEFMEFYQAGAGGKPPHHAPLTSDFPTYVREHQQRTGGPDGARSKAFWLERLAGELPHLDLPGSHPQQESLAVSSAISFFEIEESLHKRLTALAQSCGVTLFSVLLAAYQTLLMRLSGQRDVLVGVPMAGRSHPGYEGVIGHFVNMVAIRGDFNNETSFRAFVRQTWLQLQGAVENQEFPFPELVKLLRPTGRFERNPVFQTMLNFLKPAPNHPLICTLSHRPESVRWGPLNIAHFPMEWMEEHYDISMRIVETPRSLQVKLQYDRDRFDADLIDRFCSGLLELLNSATDNPDQPLTKLALLNPAQRAQLLVTWNDTAADYPRHLSVHALLAQQANRTPNSTALVFGNSRLSYRELDLRSNQLARYLQRRGIGRGDLVAVCTERSLELVVGLLGTLKAGAAYVPVDPQYPAGRIAGMIEDSDSRLLLTTCGCDQAIGSISGKPRLCLDRDWHEVADLDCDTLAETSDPLDLAYVIYTSGSTGKPKGVQITHRALVNFLWSMRERPGLNAEDVLLSVTSFSFDIFGLELFLPLIVGARVELTGSEEMVDGRLLAERLARCGATVMQATPVSWRMLLAVGFRPSNKLKALCGGEALSPDLAAELLKTGVDLWNMYGPTETTIWSCVEQVRAANDRIISIGRPIANTQAYVLDAQMEPTPIGVVGQLYLGGEGLALGYLRRAELTAEKFVPNPFRSHERELVYDTGDLARFLPDGRLECVGRIDHQVKIRGFRIELEEIEVNLRRQDGVRAAVVVPQQSERGAQRLVAFVVSDSADGISTAGLRDGLRSHLPEHMIPAQFVQLPALPLTPNGKIDRKALPFPAWGESTEESYVEPSGEIERGLADIFAQVLKASRVGANDSFFDLGGDSLSAVSLAVHIKEKFGRSITLAALFHAPTVAKLSNMIRDVEKRAVSALMPLRETGKRPPLFCLPGADGSSLVFQRLVEQMPEDRPVYGWNLPQLEEYPLAQRNIHAYALDALRRIREVCPQGPFHLLGYSFGGYVAFEVARILVEQGEPAPYLGMIDTWGPGYPSRVPLAPRTILHLRNLLSFDTATRIRYVRKRWTNFCESTQRVWRQLILACGLREPEIGTPEHFLDAMKRVANTALRGYKAELLAGRLWLFRVDTHPLEGPGLSFEDPYNGWRPFVAGEIDVTHLQGVHDEVFKKKELTHLASALTAQLEAADKALDTVSSEI